MPTKKFKNKTKDILKTKQKMKELSLILILWSIC